MAAASVISTIAALQALALVRGPSAGSPAPQSAAKLYILDDKASIPVGNAAMTGGTHYIRLGKVPKGAKLLPWLVRITTDHTAAIPGKLSLVPLSGAAATDMAGVTIQLETLVVAHDGTAMNVVPDCALDNADTVVATEDSWVHFVPTSDVVIASTAKSVWARIGYAMPY